MDTKWNEAARYVLEELKRLNVASEKTLAKIEEIKESTSKNTRSLEEHMRRTAIAEERIDNLEQEYLDVRFVKRLFKLSTTLFAVPASIYYILNIIKFFNN